MNSSSDAMVAISPGELEIHLEGREVDKYILNRTASVLH